MQLDSTTEPGLLDNSLIQQSDPDYTENESSDGKGPKRKKQKTSPTKLQGDSNDLHDKENKNDDTDQLDLAQEPPPKMSVEQRRQELIDAAQQDLVAQGKLVDLHLSEDEDEVAKCCFEGISYCHVLPTKQALQACKNKGKCNRVFHGDCYDDYLESQGMIDADNYNHLKQVQHLCIDCFELKAAEINKVTNMQSSTDSNNFTRRSCRNKNMNRKERLNLVDMMAKHNPKAGAHLELEYNGYKPNPPAKRRRQFSATASGNARKKNNLTPAQERKLRKIKMIDNQFTYESGEKISAVMYKGKRKSEEPGSVKGYIEVWFGRLTRMGGQEFELDAEWMRANQPIWEGGWNQEFLDKCKLEENRGKYIEMDPGNARNSSSINDDIKALQQGITIPELGQRWTPPLQPGNPVIVYQQYDSPTCLFKSVSNVLLYSGDRHAAEMIDYLYSSGSVTHDFFNAINQKLRTKPHHYNIYAITGLFEGSTLRFKLNMKTDSKKNQQKQQ